LRSMTLQYQKQAKGKAKATKARSVDVATKSSMFAHTVVETSIYGCLVEKKPEMKLEMLYTMRERGDPMCQVHDPMLLLKRLR